jgi:hypothetical protein
MSLVICSTPNVDFEIQAFLVTRYFRRGSYGALVKGCLVTCGVSWGHSFRLYLEVSLD